MKLSGASNDFPPLDTLYFYAVNLVCAVAVWRVFRKNGASVWRYLGCEKRRLLKDIAWGFLRLFVTYIPMITVMMGSMYLLFGADMFQHFGQLFMKSNPVLPGGLLAVITAA